MKLNWGIGILIFIIIFITLAIIFMIFSFSHSNDLVSTDYYEQGAGYTKQIEINKRSAVYNDSIKVIDVDSLIEVNVCQTIIAVSDSIDLFFFRPSNKENDYHIILPLQAKIALLKTKFIHGRYILKASWKHNNDTYLVEKEIFVKK